MSKRTLEYPGSGVRLAKNKDARGYHRIRWEDPSTGKPKEARRQEWDDAQELAEELHRAITSGAGLETPTREVSLRELIDAYLDEDLRAVTWEPATLTSRSQHLRHHFLGFMGARADCADWTPQASERFLAHLLSVAGLASSTVGTVGGGLRSLATFGLRHGHLQRDPMDGVKYRALGSRSAGTQGQARGWIDPEGLPGMDDVEALAEAFLVTRPKEPWRPLQVRLSALSGLRGGEVHALKGGDVDFDLGIIHVRRQAVYAAGTGITIKPPKGNKIRHTVLAPSLDGELRRRVMEVGRDGLLFPGYRGGVMRHTVFDCHWFTPAREKAGWPKLADGKFRWTWHDLRHFFCTHMLERGVPVVDVANWAGHHSPAFTLETYVSTSRDAALRARDLLRASDPTGDVVALVR